MPVTGSRRPFVVIGAVMLVPCAWFLLNLFLQGVTWVYFLVWYLLFYLSFISVSNSVNPDMGG